MDSSVATLSLNDKRDIYFVILSVCEESTLHLTCHSEHLRRIQKNMKLMDSSVATLSLNDKRDIYFVILSIAKNLRCIPINPGSIPFSEYPSFQPRITILVEPGLSPFLHYLKKPPLTEWPFQPLFSTNAKCSKDWEFLFLLSTPHKHDHYVTT